MRSPPGDDRPGTRVLARCPITSLSQEHSAFLADSSNSKRKMKANMSKRIVVCLMLAVSACVGEQASQQADDEDTLTTAEPQPPPSARDAETCKLASRLGLGERAVQSCEAGAPVDDAGDVAASPLSIVTPQACTTYNGACTGVVGCSRAVGGGWQYTVCGSFLHTWLKVCDGQLTGWGVSPCL